MEHGDENREKEKALTRGLFLLRCMALAQSFDDINKDNCPYECYDETVEIETRNTGLTEERHNPATDDGADDTDDDIEENALLAIRVHQKRCDPADDAAEDDPNENTHNKYLAVRIIATYPVDQALPPLPE